MKIASGSSSSLTTPVNIGTLSNKLNKISSNVNQQDLSSFNFIIRSEANQDSTSLPEKKTLFVSFFIYFFDQFIFSFSRKILRHHQ
jgi:hypothetical protein